jgi:hypothetical protein
VLEVESNVLPPSTGKPWVEITYQWLKDNLTAYIDIPSAADNASKNIAAEAVYDWSAVLKKVSNNTSAWNIHVRFIEDGNRTVYNTYPPSYPRSS